MLSAIRQHGDADVVRCTGLLLEEGEGPGLGGYLKLLAQRSTHLRRWLLFLARRAAAPPASARARGARRPR